LNAGVGQSLVLLDEPRRADHISVENDGELSRLALFHAEVPFFESGRSRDSIAGAEGWRENGSNQEMSGRSKLDFYLS